MGQFAESRRRPAVARSMKSTTAIVLRKIRLTETSLIVSWLTEEFGRVKTVAKGARGPKSKFAGVLDLFFRCEIHFARSAKSELHPLREAVLLSAHEALRFDYGRTAMAAYFVELIELVTEPEHPAPELFDLLRRALEHLEAHPASPRALLHFEAELARLLGIQQPAVTAAVALGRAYHRLPAGRRDLLGEGMK
jgi:DNA repair protein RecO (recombination protein O)